MGVDDKKFGGGNAVQDVATARTPEAMDQAILNA